MTTRAQIGLSLPDRLDAQEQFMTARLDDLSATSKVLKALYGVVERYSETDRK